MDVSILDYKPFKDGIRNDASKFQQAIDDVYKSGGGRVIVNEGHYSLGSIELKDNVCLYLKKNSYLKMSSSLDELVNLGIKKDLNIYQPTYEKCDYDGKPTKFFIYARDAKNISIEGEGTIDGNEEIFYGKQTEWHIEGAFYPRVPLLCLINIKNLTLKDVTLTNSAFWTCHLVGCDNVLIDHLTILNNLRMVNCDGIDPDHCRNVVIKNTHIESADDCIVIKSTEGYKEYGPSYNIRVSNCDLMSTSAAIKFGSESVSDFKDISFENINIHDSNRGISLQLRDEGNISNISFKNIKISTRLFSPLFWWGRAEAIALTAVRRKKDSILGSISNITFENITSIGENGIFIYGTNKNIHDIKFNNINLNIVRKTKWENNSHDIRPCYNEGIFSDHLTLVYINEASNLYLSNIKLNVEASLTVPQSDYVNILNSNNINIAY